MKTETIPQIAERDAVKFESEYGLLTGSVLFILPSIENGQRCAVVEIDHELPGILHTVPVDDLTRSAS